MFAEENLIYMSFYRFEENEDLHTHLKTKQKIQKIGTRKYGSMEKKEEETVGPWRKKKT